MREKIEKGKPLKGEVGNPIQDYIRSNSKTQDDYDFHSPQSFLQGSSQPISKQAKLQRFQLLQAIETL